ncbi:dentin sialophosphoprotein-like isoform X2 [Liolophura sinensis]|uniref:dentin sialophosphoprotein-like isoform X2 n=1 Tax=Liolophura sinensis TaxID=3198878 RepID=UPI003158C484
MAPPNGTIPVNGLTKKHRHNLPKIHIHMEGKPPSDPSSSVDDIIKEMTRIDPPLTGISTPHKEKNFPFPSGHPDPHSRLQVTKQLMDSTVHRSGNDKAHGDLSNELEVSESENEGEDGTKCDESINKPVAETQGNRSPEPEVRMSSSSDSESEESSGTSSDSGSDSESSASDGEEESVTAPPKEEPKEKVSPVETSNPSVEQTSEQNTKLRWSLSTFLMPKTNTSIIGSDIGLCDTLKDTTDSGLGDLTDSLLKSTGKSNELIPDLRADIDLPGHDSDFETHTKVRQTKKDHKTTKHKDRSSSSTESQAISSHKRASETRSPGRAQAKSPAPALQETPTVTKSPATKKGPRKNSTASEKSSKSETHRSSKSKNGLCDEKLSNVLAKSNRKAGTAASKPEGRPRGRPRSKPKTPVLLSSDSSDEEEMDVDVVSISPEKVHTPMARKISVDHADVAEKSEVSKNSAIKQTSPLQTSLSSLPSDKAKRKDSERKDKKERKKHDKQSEDKRKPKSSPLSDKENSKFSNQEKDITMSNFDVLMNDMSESPHPKCPS